MLRLTGNKALPKVAVMNWWQSASTEATPSDVLIIRES